MHAHERSENKHIRQGISKWLKSEDAVCSAHIYFSILAIQSTKGYFQMLTAPYFVKDNNFPLAPLRTGFFIVVQQFRYRKVKTYVKLHHRTPPRGWKIFYDGEQVSFCQIVENLPDNWMSRDRERTVLIRLLSETCRAFIANNNNNTADCFNWYYSLNYFCNRIPVQSL